MAEGPKHTPEEEGFRVNASGDGPPTAVEVSFHFRGLAHTTVVMVPAEIHRWADVALRFAEDVVDAANISRYSLRAVNSYESREALLGEAREALERVMSWIKNWSPMFVGEPDWAVDEARTSAILAKLRGEGVEPPAEQGQDLEFLRQHALLVAGMLDSARERVVSDYGEGRERDAMVDLQRTMYAQADALRSAAGSPEPPQVTREESETLIQRQRALLDAVEVRGHSIECRDVGGRNWFDARALLAKAAGKAEEGGRG